MTARFSRGLPSAVEVPASVPTHRAWVVVHPFVQDGAQLFRATRIEVKRELVDADVDLDRALLSSDESQVVSGENELRLALQRFGVKPEALVDPRDCACPI